MKKIVIAANTAWNLVNFRAGLIGSLISEGYEVYSAAPHDNHVKALIAMGCKFVEVPMVPSGISPLRDISTLLCYISLFRRLRPDIYLGFTIKPNVYGSIAAAFFGIPRVNNIAGLGVAFNRPGFLRALSSLLYRFSLSGSSVVFFQNQEDQALFAMNKIYRGRSDVLPGSGVDLAHFSPRVKTSGGAATSFLLVARMLYQKGVLEFVTAARSVRAVYPDARFLLLGSVDLKSEDAVPPEVIRSWVDEGIVEYGGNVSDVRPAVAEADCVVLPTYYREGVPRSLIEAAAMGKPLIATDWPGCRDIVEDRQNGFLCKVRDADDLALQMLKMCGLTREARCQLGARSRTIAVEKFDQAIVIQQYLRHIHAILDDCGHR